MSKDKSTKGLQVYLLAGIVGILVGLLIITAQLKDVVELIRVSAWPLTVLFALVSFRKEIAGMAARVMEFNVFGQNMKLYEKEKEIQKGKARNIQNANLLMKETVALALDETDEGKTVPFDDFLKDS